jgi:hypothetical protein
MQRRHFLAAGAAVAATGCAGLRTIAALPPTARVDEVLAVERDFAAFAHFPSMWRRNGAGHWLIVFDNGYDICGQPAKVCR